MRKVNRLKMELPLLYGEGTVQMIKSRANVLILERRTEQAGGQVGWALVNKIPDKRVRVALNGIAAVKPENTACIAFAGVRAHRLGSCIQFVPWCLIVWKLRCSLRILVEQ